jgi:hypothetical protein
MAGGAATQNNNHLESVVAVAAAVWASVSAVGSAATEINKRRDLVITGSLEDEPLALAHREIIMWFDWLPMILATLEPFLLTPVHIQRT